MQKFEKKVDKCLLASCDCSLFNLCTHARLRLYIVLKVEVSTPQLFSDQLTVLIED